MRTLRLWATKVTGGGLRWVKGLTRLESLNLQNSPVTGPGLEHLSALTQLQTLSLQGTLIDDVGLKYVSGLTQLRSLDLSYTKITNRQLGHLKQLTQLSDVNLQHTEVGYAGVEYLRKTLPNFAVDNELQYIDHYYERPKHGGRFQEDHELAAAGPRRRGAGTDPGKPGTADAGENEDQGETTSGSTIGDRRYRL